MAYNTKNILTDFGTKPVPQFYDPVSDTFKPLTGADLGGGHYGADHVAWGKTAGGLFAPLLVDANGHLQIDILSSVDAATQTTLAALLAKIIAAPSTEAKQDSLVTLLTAIRDTAGIKKITDALPAGTNNIGDVDVLSAVLPAGSGTLVELNLTLTGTAQQLASNACKYITIQAEPTNLGYVYLGRANTVSATVHSYVLSPGGSMVIQCSNSNLVYVFGTSGDKICGGGEA